MWLLVHATDLYVKAEEKDLSICVDSGVQQGLGSGGVWCESTGKMWVNFSRAVGVNSNVYDLDYKIPLKHMALHFNSI